MSNPARKRRRWPWILLAAVVVVAGAMLGWRFRPLNATERTLVGRWSSVGGGRDWIEFRSDRSFETTKLPFVHANDLTPWQLEWRTRTSGTWTADGDVLTLKYAAADPALPLDSRFVKSVQGLLSRRQERTPLEMEGQDKFYAFDEPFFRRID